MTLKMIIFKIVIISVFLGCNSKETERLRKENESLRKKLETRHTFTIAIREVDGLLDSIDISRKLLRTDLKKGTTQLEFSARLRDIHHYVKQSEEKIVTIEKELGASRNEAFAYMMMVDALKGEVGIRDNEVQQLESMVANYQDENVELLDSVKLQSTLVTDMTASIAQKQQQLSSLESKVHRLEKDFKLTEAEVYYARARLLEETARKTRLAAQKKRQTLTEALELYRKAFSLGKEEARNNILVLEQTVSPQVSALTELE